MQTALTAVIALLSLSLVSCFLDKETFEHNFQEKEQRGVMTAYMVLAVVLLVLALIVLPNTAQTESFSNAGIGAQAVYGCSVIIAVGGFGLQAIARYQIMQKSRNQKTLAKEDNNNHLSDSANRVVSSSEDSQQQTLDTPKEDGRKPQKEPNSKEGTEDSRKPHA